MISSSFTQFFGLVSIYYILKKIHFPVNNFFTYLLGLKLVRNILQCLRIYITSSFTHLLHTCQVHISIHMILFQQIFHLPLVFYSLLELVPMSVDLHLTASAHILYVVHWDIILSIILITLSKKYFNLFIMMLGKSISTKRVLPQVFNEMGGLNVFITYKELWKQHVLHIVQREQLLTFYRAFFEISLSIWVSYNQPMLSS